MIGTIALASLILSAAMPEEPELLVRLKKMLFLGDFEAFTLEAVEQKRDDLVVKVVEWAVRRDHKEALAQISKAWNSFRNRRMDVQRHAVFLEFSAGDGGRGGLVKKKTPPWSEILFITNEYESPRVPKAWGAILDDGYLLGISSDDSAKNASSPFWQGSRMEGHSFKIYEYSDIPEKVLDGLDIGGDADLLIDGDGYQRSSVAYMFKPKLVDSWDPEPQEDR
jgi:hypothetical protein